MRRFLKVGCNLFGASVAAVAIVAVAEAQPAIERVSVSSTGQQANADSMDPSISADGRFVAFISEATNLVAADTNGYPDVLLRDRLTGITERISVSSAGEQANGKSYYYSWGGPSVTADGMLVAFTSAASNLVPGDTNAQLDVFVRDRSSGATERVSVTSAGAQGNDWSDQPAISADGRFVAFRSNARNLVPGDTYALPDIFVHDRQTGETTRVSVASDGSEGNGASWRPAISADGRFVAFLSGASNLIPNDTNGRADVFVHDRQTGVTECVSSGVSASWGLDSAAISADGRLVAFVFTSDYVDFPCSGCGVYVRDRLTGETTLAKSGVSGVVHSDVAISEDGRHVGFDELWCAGCPRESQYWFDGITIYDTVSRTLRSVIGASWSGYEGTAYFYSPAISGEGRWVAFASSGSDLVAGDTNGMNDVFVLERWGETAPPDTAITFGPCGLVASGTSVPICWEGSHDPAVPIGLLYSWRLDSGVWQPFSTATCATLTALPPGVHIFGVKAKDADGKEDPTPAQCQFTVDLSAPSVSISSPTHGHTVRGVVNISVSASHPGGVQMVEFYIAGGLAYTDTSAPYLYSWDTRPAAVPEQLTAICAKAYAQDGGSAWACIRVNVDNTTFDDVPKTASVWPYVEALAAHSITAGCSTNPPLYCPSDGITRAQMAVFLCRAAGKGPLDLATPTFCDVPKTNPYYGWIERLADPDSWGDNPPTIGCALFPCKQYCPWKSVTRDEMAAFLVRATGKQPMPSCSGTFADVGAYWACPYVERLADPASWGGTAVTGGCATNPLRYCPKSAVTRGQMAVFLVRAFGIPL